jgi:hypothetical protein
MSSCFLAVHIVLLDSWIQSGLCFSFLCCILKVQHDLTVLLKMYLVSRCVFFLVWADMMLLIWFHFFSILYPCCWFIGTEY